MPVLGLPGAIVVGQTYSPYRKSGRPLVRPAGFGRTRPPYLNDVDQPRPANAAPRAVAPARPDTSATPAPQYASGLADPRARRWVILGALGIASSLLLTIGVALLSNRGVASASTPPVERVRQNPVTYVREIGGAPKSPTPGTGVTAASASAPGVA